VPRIGADARSGAQSSTPFEGAKPPATADSTGGQPDMAHTPAQPERMTAEAILALNDTKTDDLFVEEWGTSIKVQGLTKKQQLDVRERSLVNGEVSAEKSQGFLFLEGVVEPRFSEDQLGPLFDKNAGVIDKILGRVLELSGMKPEDIRKKEGEFRS
jgi:hypothetical protein